MAELRGSVCWEALSGGVTPRHCESAGSGSGGESDPRGSEAAGHGPHLK